MNVTQPDSRTIRVVTDSGVSFFLPYRFSWNGHDREPASVVLETTGSGARTSADVKAFFLFGLVRDRITADAGGVVISRSWNVMTSGSVKILMDVEFDAQDEPVCFFPGVHVQRGLPASPVSFLGERTSYPAALIVTLGDNAAVIFSRSARYGRDAASIGVSARERDEEPARLHAEMRFPGVEQPPRPRPEHRAQPEGPVIECSGSLEMTQELYLAFSRRHEILLTALAAVLKRLPSEPVQKPASKSAPALATFSRAAEGVLASHMVEQGGVAGLREVPGSPWLSSTAGAALAVALRRLFPRDDRIRETALRLADFSLKGQLPSGLFYESFHLDDGKWHGVKGQQSRILLSIPHSARIADLLLMLAEDLEAEGLPFEKYFLAGRRFVDLFVDDRGRCAVPAGLCAPAEEPSFGDADHRDARLRRGVQEAADIGGWEIFFPLCRVLDRLGKDRYKKAQGVIAERFAGVPWDVFRPPTSRPGRDADSAASLLVVRLFVELRRRGYRPAEPKAGGVSDAARSAESTRLFASLLFPWIRIHGNAGQGPGEPLLDGTLVDSFARQRLLFAGNETAYLLKRLSELAVRGDLRLLLEELSRVCLAGCHDVPPGTAFFLQRRWDPEGKAEAGIPVAGPVDSRRLASELLHGLLTASRPHRPSASRPATKRQAASKPSAQSGPGARFRKPSGKP